MLRATTLSSVEGSLVARNPRQISNAAQINPATASKTSAINGVFHFPISDSLAVLLARETDIVSEPLLTSCQFRRLHRTGRQTVLACSAAPLRVNKHLD